MEKKKQLIIETLDKIDKKDLPLVVKDLKTKALLRLLAGEITQDAADLLLETCEEYLATHGAKA